MKKHINLTVSGKVQGVGFRFSCMEAAYKFGVRGYVRNNRDGSVFIEAEGEEEAVNNFLDWCDKGPVWARIRKIEIEEDKWFGFDSFEIQKK